MEDTNKTNRILCDCGHYATPTKTTTGYRTDTSGKKYCYDCCAKKYRAELFALPFGERTAGYLSDKRPEVETLPRDKARRGVREYAPNGVHFTDWAGRFRVPVTAMKYSLHNIAGIRIDFWFHVSEGDEVHHYHGVNIGDQQFSRVERVKKAYKER